MGDRLTTCTLVVAIAAFMLPGCVGTDKDLKYLNEAEVTHHKNVAQTIDYPDVHSSTVHEAAATAPPRTIASRKKDAVKDLKLQAAVQISLANSRIIRSGTEISQPGNQLWNNPQFISSIYDPAIQESGVLFGGRGVEAALADFDTTYSTAMLWGRSEAVQNNIFFGGGLTPGNTLQQDTGTFRSALAKRFADGGSFLVGHDWDYRGAFVPGQLFPSTYTGNLRAEYRRPLWAASGTEYTQIAGPSNPNFGAITGVSQGVVIARINNDITLSDFEASVRNLVSDVQNAYWALYLAYRVYDTSIVARNSAKRTWQEAAAKKKVGGVAGFALQDESQALDQYYESQAQVNTALNQVYAAEIKLRRLMALPVNDGTIFRPADEPTMGELALDWEMALSEALTRRVELRRQKWQIKSLQLQLKAAKSLTNPRLDFTTSYQVNGFGDHLFGQNDNDGAASPQGLNSAYETLTQGNQTSWTAGLEFSMPLGFRSARAQVRNLELRMLKAQQVLAAQEFEVSYELAAAFQDLAVHYANMKANYERISAARERLRIVEEQYRRGLRVGPLAVTADIVLRAQRDLARAESDFYGSRVDYDKAIAQIEFRKGSLLEYYNVFLAESDWTPQAYQQALRRARGRSNAIDNDRLLHSEPEVFAYRRPMQPHHGHFPGGFEGHSAPPSKGHPGVPPKPDDSKTPPDPKMPAKKPAAPNAPPEKSAKGFPAGDSSVIRAGHTGLLRQLERNKSLPVLGELDGYQQDAIAPRTAK